METDDFEEMIEEMALGEQERAFRDAVRTIEEAQPPAAADNGNNDAWDSLCQWISEHTHHTDDAARDKFQEAMEIAEESGNKLSERTAEQLQDDIIALKEVMARSDAEQRRKHDGQQRQIAELFRQLQAEKVDRARIEAELASKDQETAQERAANQQLKGELTRLKTNEARRKLAAAGEKEQTPQEEEKKQAKDSGGCPGCMDIAFSFDSYDEASSGKKFGVNEFTRLGGQAANYAIEKFTEERIEGEGVPQATPCPVVEWTIKCKTCGRSESDSYAACFAGDGLVRMACGTTTRVDRLRVGDTVATPDGPRRVALVVADHVCRTLPMCVINELAITPEHPFMHADGRWHLPQQCHAVKRRHMDVLYNLELENGHACWVNEVLVVTLGQTTIPPTDPAYSEWADSQWGWGWRDNPRRQRFMRS